MHNNLLFPSHPRRVTISEQTATLFAADFSLLIEHELIVHRATQRRFERVATGVTVATRLGFIAQIRLENPCGTDREEIFIGDRLSDNPPALN